MRPLRVKVRKPPISEEEDEEPVPDPMDDTFGLKNVMTKDDLVLEPTPAVPDKPVSTGCPVKLFLLCNLLFCRLLLIQIAKVGTFLKNSGNLLHDRHKNFENRFRNS